MKTFASIAALGLLLAAPAFAEEQSSSGAYSDQSAQSGSAVLPKSGGEKAGEPGASSSMAPSAIEDQQASTLGSHDADLGQNKDVVRKLQTELKDAGYDVGEVDGIMGPQTSEALKKYQQDKGMQATGRIDENTLASMNIESPQQAASPQSSSQTDVGTSQQSR